ncbi:hypothetical protein GCM10010260_66590 [Streptomyces filipinensis]|uniref:Uncharacterized protein n=1 Tax=Streptomyces filipinensis TaxID=66887 RepID=A0A918IJN7_9ACTN|nr:hypothetical protein GCM10010260_66590 [Streptomyces filipinensis]
MKYWAPWITTVGAVRSHPAPSVQSADGVEAECRPPAPYAVRDGRLITGQNPVSAEAVSDVVLAAAAGDRATGAETEQPVQRPGRPLPRGAARYPALGETAPCRRSFS